MFRKYKMTDLIKISKESISGEVVNSANAREIHKFLEVKTRFNDWIKRAIEKYGFEENIDYSKMSNVNTTDYIVTLDMAKELSMLENNPKGKQTRKYFIKIEKESNKVLTLPEQIQLIAQGYEAQNTRLQIVEHKIDNEILLTSAQKHNLKSTVNKKIYGLKEKHSFSDDFIRKGYSKIWKKVKAHFVVSSYMEIPKVRFDEAVQMVQKIEMEDLI